MTKCLVHTKRFAWKKMQRGPPREQFVFKVKFLCQVKTFSAIKVLFFNTSVNLEKLLCTTMLNIEVVLKCREFL